MSSFVQSNKVQRSDLHRMTHNYSAVFSESDANSDDAVMEGLFHYRYHYGGLSVHSSNATELQDISSLVELPACLSFNIVFEGSVDFSLGADRYQLGSETAQQPECSAIVLAQPEVLTRYLQKGMQVNKLNVFAERTWLEARSQSHEDLLQLEQLFERSETVSSWPASDKMIELAKLLIKNETNPSYKASLEYEYLAIKLLSCCIEQLSLFIELQQPIEKKVSKAAKKELRLKQCIDEQLSANLILQDIALSLGISISTLQRKFKAAYGITVNSYCRQRRLEMARAALTIDDLSIGEAAYLAGYNHTSNFITAFKKRFGITPTALVKTHKLQRSH